MLNCTSGRLDLLMENKPGQDRVFHYLPFCFAGSWIMLLTCLLRRNLLTLNMDLGKLRGRDARRPRQIISSTSQPCWSACAKLSMNNFGKQVASRSQFTAAPRRRGFANAKARRDSLTKRGSALARVDDLSYDP